MHISIFLAFAPCVYLFYSAAMCASTGRRGRKHEEKNGEKGEKRRRGGIGRKSKRGRKVREPGE